MYLKYSRRQRNRSWFAALDRLKEISARKKRRRLLLLQRRGWRRFYDKKDRHTLGGAGGGGARGRRGRWETRIDESDARQQLKPKQQTSPSNRLHASTLQSISAGSCKCGGTIGTRHDAAKQTDTSRSSALPDPLPVL